MVSDSVLTSCKVKVLVTQSCLTFYNPMDCNLPASFIHGIFQTRILETVVAISFSRGSSWPRDQTQVSYIIGRFFTVWVTRKAGSRKPGPFLFSKSLSSCFSNDLLQANWTPSSPECLQLPTPEPGVHKSDSTDPTMRADLQTWNKLFLSQETQHKCHQTSFHRTT